MSSMVEGIGIKNDVISKNVKSNKLYTELLQEVINYSVLKQTPDPLKNHE